METGIREAIRDRALQATLLEAGNTFSGRATEEAPMPYCVITLAANPFSRDTKNKYEEYHIQFGLHGKDQKPLEDMEAELIALFDNGEAGLQALVPSGYRVIAIIRDFREQLVIDELYYGNYIRYRIEVEVP